MNVSCVNLPKKLSAMEIYPTQNHLKFSFKSKSIDIGKVIRKTNQSLKVEPQIMEAEKFYNVERDYDLENDGAKPFILDHNTTQGIVIGKYNDDVMHIVIPALSTEADIAYAFCLLDTLAVQYPTLSIQSEKGFDEAVAHCRNNMHIYLTAEVDEDDYEWDFLIRGYAMGTEITIDMLKKQYALSDKHIDIDQMIDLAFTIFCRLQWTATFLPHAEHSIMPAKHVLNHYDDCSKNVVIILNRNLFVNVSWCEIVLSVNGLYKSVSHKDFYKAALHSNNIEVLTYGQYAISKMSSEEWVNFCESIPGTLF